GQFDVAAAFAQVVEPCIAADEDQPGDGIARRTVLRPVFQRPQAGFLEGFLGAVEIAEIAQQGCDRLGPRAAERRVDPGEVRHSESGVPGRKTRSGRISKLPRSSLPCSSVAKAITSSRLSASTT